MCANWNLNFSCSVPLWQLKYKAGFSFFLPAFLYRMDRFNSVWVLYLNQFSIQSLSKDMNTKAFLWIVWKGNVSCRIPSDFSRAKYINICACIPPRILTCARSRFPLYFITAETQGRVSLTSPQLWLPIHFWSVLCRTGDTIIFHSHLTASLRKP